MLCKIVLFLFIVKGPHQNLPEAKQISHCQQAKYDRAIFLKLQQKMNHPTTLIFNYFVLFDYYPPMKSEGYSFGVVTPSSLFGRPEPYLSTYWSDLIHSWY